MLSHRSLAVQNTQVHFFKSRTFNSILGFGCAFISFYCHVERLHRNLSAYRTDVLKSREALVILQPPDSLPLRAALYLAAMVGALILG